jgi:gliding motility-associated-like protein
MKFLAFILIVFWTNVSFSQEILGGDITWKGERSNVFGLDNLIDDLTLNLYVKDFPLVDNTEDILVYRKSDGKFIDAITLTKIGSPVVITNSNLVCTVKNKIVAYHQIYKATYNFKKKTYADLGGYYMVYDNNFRSAELKNIQTPNKIAFSIVSEFPAYLEYDLPNRSPYFKTTNQLFFCKGENFQLDFSSVDEDKFKLKYSLNKPLQGNAEKGTYGNPKLKYRPKNKYANWETSYSNSNILGKNASFEIDQTTGIISGKTNNIGLFTFSIKVDKYNLKGDLVGYNIKDMSVWIVDCPVATLPKSVITENSVSVSEAGICDGSMTTLEVPKNINQTYQWQKNGENIDGEVSENIKVKTAGNYNVIVSDKNICVREQKSDPVKVYVKNLGPEIDRQTKYSSIHDGCFDKPVILKVANNPDNKAIEWYKNSSTGLLFLKESPTLEVYQTGNYLPKFKVKSGCTIDLVSNLTKVQIGLSYPKISLTPDVGGYLVCPEKFVELRTSYFGPSSTFKWYKDNQELTAPYPKYETNIPGDYHVLVGEIGCYVKSEIYKVRPASDCPKDVDFLVYPNAFSPNGDGVHDDWEILNMDLFIDLEVFIYDRWGKMVFYNKGYKQRFDGFFNGQPVDTGTYYYTIKHNRASVPDRSGELFILR